MFVTPAAGLCIMLATFRGLRGDKDLGDFYVDLMRSFAVRLRAVRPDPGGAPGRYRRADDLPRRGPGHDDRRRRDQDRRPRRSPAARWPRCVAIKQAGTNGGGFFGPNSTHPFENPSPWSNLISICAIVVLPMASLVMAGLMLKNRRHAAVIYGVMLSAASGRVSSWPSRPSSSRAPPPTGCPWPGRRTWRARRSGSARSPRRPGRP